MPANPPSPSGSSHSSVLSDESYGDVIRSADSTGVLAERAISYTARIAGRRLSNRPRVKPDLLLQGMIQNAIGVGQRYAAAVVIAAASDNERLLEVAEAWLVHLLLPMKTAGALRTVPASSIQTPTYDETATLIEPTTRNQSWLKRQLTLRDGDRCTVSGNVSETEFDRLLALGQADSLEPDIIEAAHIIPFSLNHFAEEDHEKFHNAVTTWDILKSWTTIDIEALAGDHINDTTNAINLSMTAHAYFGNFTWWFEPTPTLNVYRVESGRFTFGYKDKEIEFVDRSNSSIPLPDPLYIAVHAAFGRVLRLSGAGEYFEKVHRDAEENGAIRADGSTDIGTMLARLAFHPRFVTVGGK